MQSVELIKFFEKLADLVMEKQTELDSTWNNGVVLNGKLHLVREPPFTNFHLIFENPVVLVKLVGQRVLFSIVGQGSGEFQITVSLALGNGNSFSFLSPKISLVDADSNQLIELQIVK